MTADEELAQRYDAALSAYLASGNEAGLEQAYMLGRKALDVGVGLLDVAAIHREALLRELPTRETQDARIFDLACRFFAECLAPFEMTQRGFKETNERLQADIAERKRVEAELVRSNTELEQFAYIASHDLQEPLRQVVAFSQFLDQRYRDKLDETAREFLDFIVEGGRRMRGLIQDLLAYSRVGRQDKARVNTSLQEVLEQALFNLMTSINESGAVITQDPLPTLKITPRQFMQVFQNLIGNAIKFRGENAPRIHVGARSEDSRWLFWVQDNGIGFSQEYHDKIFLIFQRLHTHEAYPGSGIGLPICQRIVEHHGGRIWAESEPGQGATFYFTVPVA